MRSRGAIGFLLAAVPAVLSGCGDDDGDSVGGACQPKRITIEVGADGSPIPLEPPADGDALAVAIADSFCSPTWTVTFADDTTETFPARLVLPSDHAMCIGDRVVDELGVDRLRELSFPGPWDLLGFGLSNNSSDQQIERPEAEVIVGTFEDCSPLWKHLLILSVTEGTDEMSDASASCASEHLVDDDARAIFMGEVDRAYDDPAATGAQPFAESVQPLTAAFDACLTPEELDRIDWN